MSDTDPRDVAVVIAAHGDRGGEAPNAILKMHARALSDRDIFQGIYPGTLKSPELPLENALLKAAASGARHIAVYPMFMADGYFTNSVLPDRIAEAGLSARCRLLPPLGVDPQLLPVMLDWAGTAAGDCSLDPVHARLLIAGHGSKFGRASLEATERAAEGIRTLNRFAQVETAYLEESPFLDAKLAGAGSETLVLGFFSGEGMYAGEDVPAAIARAGSKAHYAGPIGRHPTVARLIEAAVAAIDW